MNNLVKVNIYTNYGTVVSSAFLANDDEVEDYKQLDGIEISFGELEGKHSDVFGEFKSDNMTVTELSEDESGTIEKHFGKHISGIYIFDYVEVAELFFNSFRLFESSISESINLQLDNALRKQVVANKSYINDLSQVHYYHIVDMVADTIPLKSLKAWEEILEDRSLNDKEQASFNQLVSTVLEQWIKDNTHKQGDEA